MYSTEFQIGDTVRLIDDGNTYLVVAIQIQTYIGFNRSEEHTSELQSLY